MEEGDTREPVAKEVRLLVPVQKSHLPQRVTYGVVLEPDIEDLQGDVMTAEDIEKAAYDWMERSQHGGHMHANLVEGAQVVESFIAPCDIPFETAEGQETIRKGSWVLAMRWPPDIWESIAKGELTGYSVGGTGVRVEIEKHGEHDQSEHGNWARGRGVAGMDPGTRGAATEGGGTPADEGAAAAENSKWQEWGESQRGLGNRLTIDNSNEHAVAIRVQQHEGPDDFMTVTPEQARQILAEDPSPGGAGADEHAPIEPREVRVRGMTFERVPSRYAAFASPKDPEGAAFASGPGPGWVGGDTMRSTNQLEDFKAGMRVAGRVADRIPCPFKDSESDDYDQWMTGTVVGRPELEGQTLPYVDVKWDRWHSEADVSGTIPEALWIKKDEGDAVTKHGSHDQSTHGNWARGRKTLAEDGNTAGRADGARAEAEDEYAAETLRSLGLVDDIEELLQDWRAPSDDFKPNWGDASGAGEVDHQLADVQAFLSGDEDAYAQAQAAPTEFKTAEDAYSARMLSSFERVEAIREVIQDRPAPTDDFRPTWGHVGDAKETNRGLEEVRAFMNPQKPTTGLGVWDRPAPELLRKAVREGLRDAVAKHGSHDQASHGNWARAGEGGPTESAEWTDSEMKAILGARDTDTVEQHEDGTYTITHIVDGSAASGRLKANYIHRLEMATDRADLGDLRIHRTEMYGKRTKDGGRLAIRFSVSQHRPVKKHGTHDQSTHGNWARAREKSPETLEAWNRHLTAPTPEERARAGEEYARLADQDDARARAGGGKKHTTRDGVRIEEQMKVKRVDGGGRLIGANGVEVDCRNSIFANGQRPPRVTERARWAVHPMEGGHADHSPDNIIWSEAYVTLAEFMATLPKGEYELAT